MSIKLKSPDPTSNLNTYIACAIVSVCAIATIYYRPTSVINAKVDRVSSGTNASGIVYLAKVSEPERATEQFETSESQAKLLKECEMDVDTSQICYVNLIVVNGLLPFVSDRQIINVQILKSGDANYPRRPNY